MILKNVFSKRFYYKFLRLIFFIFYDAFAKDLFFYYKSIVRRFKLINSFNPCPNSIAPSTPIDFPLYFKKILIALYLLNIVWIFLYFCYLNFISSLLINYFSIMFLIIFYLFLKLIFVIFFCVLFYFYLNYFLLFSLPIQYIQSFILSYIN